MPLDAIVAWLLQPIGLLAFASVVIVGCAAWMLALGNARKLVGARPIVWGYLAGIASPLLFLITVKAYELSYGQHASAIRPEEFWGVVVHHVLYIFTLALVVLLPVYAALAAIAGRLVHRQGVLRPQVWLIGCLALALAAGTAIWWFSSGRWLLWDHLVLLAKAIGATLLVVVATAVPFFVAVQVATHRRSRGEA